jgi:hypothetical protein
MIQLLGWIGSVLVVLSLTLRRQLPFRMVNLASAGVLFVFNFAIGLWSMVVLNTTIMIVNLYQLRRTRRPRPALRAPRHPGLVQAPPAEGWFSRETQLRRHPAAGDSVGSQIGQSNVRTRLAGGGWPVAGPVG